MLPSLVRLMCCPVCAGEMTTSVFEKVQGHIISGILSCSNCTKKYLIKNSIPRMVPLRIIEGGEKFCQQYNISQQDVLLSWPDENGTLASLQAETQYAFGGEWENYANLGVNDSVGQDASSFEESKLWFSEKLLIDAKDVKGKMVLDAGCGNGRYSTVAASYGANVISMDLTKAADVTYNNLSKQGYIPRVIQGDILHLPLKKETFPVVYCIGVVQHTGAPLEAIKGLSSLVSSKGIFALRTYRLANSRLEENDTAIREVTTKFSLSELDEFAEIITKLSDFLLRKNLYERVAMHINIFPKKYDNFDWYAAPVADKLEYNVLRTLFETLGFRTIRDLDDGIEREKRRFGAISILTRKAE